MLTKFFRFPDHLSRPARIAFGVVTLMVSVLILGLIIFAYQVRQVAGDLWQFRVITISAICVILVQLASLPLIWRGRHEQGTWWAFFAWLVLLPIVSALLSGLAFPLFLVAIIPVSTLLASRILSQRSSALLVVGSFIVGIAVLVADWFLPIKQMTLPGFVTVAYILVGILVIVLGIILLRQFPLYSLRVKQLVALLSIALVIMIAFGLVVSVQTRSQLTRDTALILQNMADSQGRAVGDFLSKQVDTLTVLGDRLRGEIVQANMAYTGTEDEIRAQIQQLDEQWIAADEAGNDQDPLVASRLRHPAASILTNYRQSFPENVEVFITDQYGAVIAATNRTSDYDQADEQWWQTAYNGGVGKLYIGNMAYEESAQVYSVNIAIPIYALNSNRVIGVLRTTVITDSLVALLEASGQIQDAHSDILFPDGTMLTEQGLEEINKDEQKALETATRPYAEINYRGTPSFISTSPIVGSNPAIQDVKWLLVVHQSREIALAPLESQLRVMVMTGLILAGLTIGAAFLLAQILTKPILELTNIATRVAAGDLAVEAKVESLDEVGQLANTFNNMTRQLAEAIVSLEERVAARTKDLATVAEVSTATSTILNTRQLLQSVVDLTKERFELYHAHIYLLDEAGENLVLTAGAGEPGRQMVAKGHAIPLERERSLVARAARERQGVIANDVIQEPDFLPNPLLPQTRSEMAVPMIVGGNVIGVFDVQSEQVGRFSEADVSVYTTLAAQVAVSVQNVRSFEKARTQAELETLVNAIGQKIQRAATPEETLQTTVRELGTALGASRVLVNIRLASGDKNSPVA